MFGFSGIFGLVMLSILSFPAAALYLTIVLNRRPR
jgi:hypothetical protein